MSAYNLNANVAQQQQQMYQQPQQYVYSHNNNHNTTTAPFNLPSSIISSNSFNSFHQLGPQPTTTTGQQQQASQHHPHLHHASVAAQHQQQQQPLSCSPTSFHGDPAIQHIPQHQQHYPPGPPYYATGGGGVVAYPADNGSQQQQHQQQKPSYAVPTFALMHQHAVTQQEQQAHPLHAWMPPPHQNHPLHRGGGGYAGGALSCGGSSSYSTSSSAGGCGGTRGGSSTQHQQLPHDHTTYGTTSNGVPSTTVYTSSHRNSSALVSESSNGTFIPQATGPTTSPFIPSRHNSCDVMGSSSQQLLQQQQQPFIGSASGSYPPHSSQPLMIQMPYVTPPPPAAPASSVAAASMQHYQQQVHTSSVGYMTQPQPQQHPMQPHIVMQPHPPVTQQQHAALLAYHQHQLHMQQQQQQQQLQQMHHYLAQPQFASSTSSGSFGPSSAVNDELASPAISSPHKVNHAIPTSAASSNTVTTKVKSPFVSPVYQELMSVMSRSPQTSSHIAAATLAHLMLDSDDSDADGGGGNAVDHPVPVMITARSNQQPRGSGGNRGGAPTVAASTGVRPAAGQHPPQHPTHHQRACAVAAAGPSSSAFPMPGQPHQQPSTAVLAAQQNAADANINIVGSRNGIVMPTEYSASIILRQSSIHQHQAATSRITAPAD